MVEVMGKDETSQGTGVKVKRESVMELIEMPSFMEWVVEKVSIKED